MTWFEQSPQKKQIMKWIYFDIITFENLAQTYTIFNKGYKKMLISCRTFNHLIQWCGVFIFRIGMLDISSKVVFCFNYLIK